MIACCSMADGRMGRSAAAALGWLYAVSRCLGSEQLDLCS